MNANSKKAKENVSKNKKMRLIRLDDLAQKRMSWAVVNCSSEPLTHKGIKVRDLKPVRLLNV